VRNNDRENPELCFHGPYGAVISVWSSGEESTAERFRPLLEGVAFLLNTGYSWTDLLFLVAEMSSESPFDRVEIDNYAVFVGLDRDGRYPRRIFVNDQGTSSLLVCQDVYSQEMPIAELSSYLERLHRADHDQESFDPSDLQADR
jgi:hypothetical protein